MENFILNYGEFFRVNEAHIDEMASTLTKLPIPKKMVTAIHRLSSEDVKPFTYAHGQRGREQDWKHGGGQTNWQTSGETQRIIDKITKDGIDSLTDEQKEILASVENDAASQGYKNLSRDHKALLIASKTYNDPGVLPHDVKILDPREIFPELTGAAGVQLKTDEKGVPYARFKKTRLLGNKYDLPRREQEAKGRRKDPGFLADISNTPWGGMRMLMSVPDENRYDYVYYKGRAYYARDERGGKKYRVVTMDEEGNLVRDWMAYQGKIKFPSDVGGGESRDDFKTFPKSRDGYIDVYFLDVTDTSAQEKRTERIGDRKITNAMFLETFKIKFERILESIFGNRKDKARTRFAEILGDLSPDEAAQAMTGEASDEMLTLRNFLNNNETALDRLESEYGKFLKYMKLNGSYEGIMDRGGKEWQELSELIGNLSGNADSYAHIEDIVAIHSMAASLRKFAEYIVTGEIKDTYSESESERTVGDFEEFTGDREEETGNPPEVEEIDPTPADELEDEEEDWD